MGQAKNRGTFEQRKAEAIARDAERKRQRDESNSGFARPKLRTLAPWLALAAVAGMNLNGRSRP